ncbi:pyridoxamine 5'-phosphate oxidase family protein [Arthrobacter sp. TMN-37]
MENAANEFWEMPGTLHASAELSPDECWSLLTTQRAGRIGFSKNGSLYIFPVNYLVHAGGIYFRTSAEGELGRAPLGASAFQVDSVQPEAMAGWTVLAQGSPEPVEDEALLKTLWGRAVEEPWASGLRTRFVGLRPTAISGRRVGTA